ncbi:MAG: transposase [Candidatus Doudnabacteria bacterium]|nr:transposase [Candidatus Doudnabacteria bacterium]
MGIRDYKEFGAGAYYHIYNRGNAKNNIFIDPEDYKFFLLRLRQNLYPEDNPTSRIRKLPANTFSLIAYCLMPNHFHILIKQNGNIPTSKLILKLCSSYSKYFNKKYDRVGHVFQDQFKQVLIDDDSYLLWLSAYIHQNPTVAGISKTPETYPWSSYMFYLKKDGYISCESDIILNQFKTIQEFPKFTTQSLDAIKLRKELDSMLIDSVAKVPFA